MHQGYSAADVGVISRLESVMDQSRAQVITDSIHASSEEPNLSSEATRGLRRSCRLCVQLITTGSRRRYVYRSPSCDRQRMRIVPAATNAAGVALLLAALIFPSRTSAQQIAATRAGIAPVAMSAARVTTQHQDSVSGHRGSRKSHVVIGVVAGALAGGVLGGLSARSSKDTGTALDGVATAASVTIGALAGLIVGGVIGAFVPHN
jgi:hypothetical protein